MIDPSVLAVHEAARKSSDGIMGIGAFLHAHDGVSLSQVAMQWFWEVLVDPLSEVGGRVLAEASRRRSDRASALQLHELPEAARIPNPHTLEPSRAQVPYVLPFDAELEQTNQAVDLWAERIATALCKEERVAFAIMAQKGPFAVGDITSASQMPKGVVASYIRRAVASGALSENDGTYRLLNGAVLPVRISVKETPDAVFHAIRSIGSGSFDDIWLRLRHLLKPKAIHHAMSLLDEMGWITDHDGGRTWVVTPLADEKMDPYTAWVERVRQIFQSWHAKGRLLGMSALETAHPDLPVSWISAAIKDLERKEWIEATNCGSYRYKE